MNRFVENNQTTLVGKQLIRLIDEHIKAKTSMSEELRHYSTVVYKTRLMKPAQWLESYPEKAEVLWNNLIPDESDDDGDQPPTFGTQPWIINK